MSRSQYLESYRAFLNGELIIEVKKTFVRMLNKEVEAYLKRNPHVAYTIEDELYIITHDDDRAHYILSTPGAGR
jgi:hypothetical protein